MANQRAGDGAGLRRTGIFGFLLKNANGKRMYGAVFACLISPNDMKEPLERGARKSSNAYIMFGGTIA